MAKRSGQLIRSRKRSISATTRAARAGRLRPCPFASRTPIARVTARATTVFEHNSHAIGQELTIFVPVNEDGHGDPVKVYRLRLRNDSGRPRRLTVTYFAEWVLGTTREDLQFHVNTSRDEASGALLARQYWTGAYTEQIAFAASVPKAASYSGDRTQFLGRNESASHPAALDRARLDNRTGPGLDPAAALQIHITIEPGQQREVWFLLVKPIQPRPCVSCSRVIKPRNRWKRRCTLRASSGTRN